MSGQLRGSKQRCQKLTGLDKHKVASALTQLASPSNAIVTEKDKWMPCGPNKPQEARLGNRINLIPENIRADLVNWWLYKVANTPNWDIASQCTIANRKGLILIEAKAHYTELDTSPKRKPNTTEGAGYKNHERIGEAIKQANTGLRNILPGDWKLSRDTHYQLSNRFAWSWKLASLGIPVVLIYLCFLNADDMPNPFYTSQTWEKCIREYSKGIVPDHAWNKRIEVGGTPLWFLIKHM
jgi:hypothetical protein